MQGVVKKIKTNLQIINLENKWRMQAQETLLGCLQRFRNKEKKEGFAP
jgi:hypothetical protein